MFTGLVECQGKVKQLRRATGAALLILERPALEGDLALGDSLAVNGACLTISAITQQEVSLAVSFETLERTNLGLLQPGDLVNLERALRLDGRLGGHLVTGHVDCTGRRAGRREFGDFVKLDFEAPRDLLALVVEKGSVAVDGVSLTVNSVSGSGFSVMVIPHTLASTTLGCQNGDRPVNLEGDLIGKYVKKFLGAGRQDDSRLLELLGGGAGAGR